MILNAADLLIVGAFFGELLNSLIFCSFAVVSGVLPGKIWNKITLH
jgi:hypothetical protein